MKKNNIEQSRYIFPELPDEENIHHHQSSKIAPQNAINEHELINSIVQGVSSVIHSEIKKLQTEIVEEIQTFTTKGEGDVTDTK